MKVKRVLCRLVLRFGMRTDWFEVVLLQDHDVGPIRRSDDDPIKSERHRTMMPSEDRRKTDTRFGIHLIHDYRALPCPHPSTTTTLYSLVTNASHWTSLGQELMLTSIYYGTYWQLARFKNLEL